MEEHSIPARPRRLAYLRTLAARELGPPEGFAGGSCFAAIPALELELQGELAKLPWEYVEHSLALLYERQDCQDFSMAALARMLYRYPRSSLLNEARREQLVAAFVQAKYQELDPTEDSCCWHTENHQVLYGAAEYLIGQLLPETTFTTTRKLGCWHRERARERLCRWLEWRLRFGFSEWNSSCYYDEDAAALINLAEFAADPRLREAAAEVLRRLVQDVASTSWRGLTAYAQGRAYEAQAKHPATTAMATLAALLWGDEVPPRPAFAALFIAAGELALPAELAAIGRETRPAVVRMRQSLHPDEGPALGIFPDRQRDLDFWRGAGVAQHPAVVDAEYAWRDGKGKWDGFFAARDYYQACREAGRDVDREGQPHALTSANLYTFKCPEYVLSCAQSYRPGRPGYQQFIWCAALGPEAVVFTTNPAPPEIPYGRPGPWVGNGILPRVLQHRQVLMALHRVRPYPLLNDPPWWREDRVHAWVPIAAFDEVREVAGWLFLRHQDGYLALGATVPGSWREENEWNYQTTDVAVVFELGSRREHGSFDAFVAAQRTLVGDVEQLAYTSALTGRFSAGWEAPLQVNEQIVPVDGYPRLDAPWASLPFGIAPDR